MSAAFVLGVFVALFWPLLALLGVVWTLYLLVAALVAVGERRDAQGGGEGS